MRQPGSPESQPASWRGDRLLLGHDFRRVFRAASETTISLRCCLEKQATQSGEPHVPLLRFGTYFLHNFANASAASLSARSCCRRLLSMRVRRGRVLRKSASAFCERLSSLFITARAASKMILGSWVIGFGGVLMEEIRIRLRRFNNTGVVA